MLEVHLPKRDIGLATVDAQLQKVDVNLCNTESASNRRDDSLPSIDHHLPGSNPL